MPDIGGLRCEPITDEDGTVIGTARVCGPLTERDRAAIQDLMVAVQRRMEEEDTVDPDAGQRQQEAIARVRERAGLRADTDGMQP